jgi:hypothetical protein
MEQIHEIQDYVPHEIVPGEYGDYVELEINSDGAIDNWEVDADELCELINGEE